MRTSEQYIPDGLTFEGLQLAVAISELPRRLPASVIPIRSRKELAELDRRDVGADTLDPQVDVYAHPERGTVSFRLDERTAAVVVYAVRLMAADYEGYAHEVRLAREMMPFGSYGEKNRLEIAQRKERIARRLRAVDRAYQKETEREFWGI